MFIFFCLSLILLFLYIILIGLFGIGWLKLSSFKPDLQKKDTIGISVLIAIRNEEANILPLIKSLKEQVYDCTLTEVILINDHSTDETFQVASQSLEHISNFTLHSLPVGKQGKKLALQEGINLAKNELLVFTDADCKHHALWLKTIAQFYLSENKPELIIAPVDFNISTNLFQWLQNLEFLSLIGTGLGSAALKQPIMANGANLAAKRETYLHQNLQSKISSGDDVFLLHSIKQMFPDKIRGLKSREAITFTQSSADINHFLNQRKRWASKTTNYTDKISIFTALIVFSLNLSIAFLLINSLIWGLQPLFLLVFLGKMLIDFLFFIPVLTFFKKIKLLLILPIMIFIYPYYISYSAIAGIIKKPFQWKGRILNI